MPYTLVDVDERVAAILQIYRRVTFDPRFKAGRYVPSNRLLPGDVIAISIFEVGGATLFGARPTAPAPTPTTAPTTVTVTGGATTIPPQTIEADGSIMVPFVGRMRAAGKTPGQLGREIQKELEGKAVEPQVIVTVITSAANTVTVGGDVHQPRPVPLTLRGERLLDVIAAAGGARYPAYETYVSVVRGGQVGTVLLQTVVADPAENIVVRPGDQIFVTRYPRTFAVLGATTRVSQYTFDTPRVSLAEAVARAGGPMDLTGDPAGIFLFRYEPIKVAKQILGKEAALTALATAVAVAAVPRDFVPILYRVDLRRAAGYFQSQDIELQDKDVVLVANAEGVQIGKMVTLIRGFTGIAYDLRRGAGS